MFIWAGIDEAGYGPLLGPLVVAAACFTSGRKPSEGFLWDLLSDSVSDSFLNLAGRIVVADSKLVYSRARGIRHLEESVLCFSRSLGHTHGKAGDFLLATCTEKPEDTSPFFLETGNLALPVASNRASIESKAGALLTSLTAGEISFVDACACPVLPAEYNRIVACTKNKSLVLWQKCGLLLQRIWQTCTPAGGFVLVDRHGGRTHYRRLLLDAFPRCACDIAREGDEGSVYRVSDGDRSMWVAFKKKADSLALPVALSSMLAKYIRELYMLAFNSYWCGKIEGLRPTAGYAADAGRFLKDIEPLLENENIDHNDFIRLR